MTEFEELKGKIRKFFDIQKDLECPAFPKEKIYFNTKGVYHLLYKRRNSERLVRAIKTRYALLPHAVKLLRVASIWQHHDSLTRMNGQVHHFWGFEGVIDNRRICVVVRQMGDKGRKIFFSVIPRWKRDRFGNVVNTSIKLHQK